MTGKSSDNLPPCHHWPQLHQVVDNTMTEPQVKGAYHLERMKWRFQKFWLVSFTDSWICWIFVVFFVMWVILSDATNTTRMEDWERDQRTTLNYMQIFAAMGSPSCLNQTLQNWWCHLRKISKYHQIWIDLGDMTLIWPTNSVMWVNHTINQPFGNGKHTT